MSNKSDKVLTRHHRICKSNKGSDDASNISMVPLNKHQAFHLLFKNHPPKVIAQILSQVWIDPNYQLIVVKRRQRRRL